MFTPSWPSCVATGGPATHIWAGMVVLRPPMWCWILAEAAFLSLAVLVDMVTTKISVSDLDTRQLSCDNVVSRETALGLTAQYAETLYILREVLLRSKL